MMAESRNDVDEERERVLRSVSVWEMMERERLWERGMMDLASSPGDL